MKRVEGGQPVRSIPGIGVAAFAIRGLRFWSRTGAGKRGVLVASDLLC